MRTDSRLQTCDPFRKNAQDPTNHQHWRWQEGCPVKPPSLENPNQLPNNNHLFSFARFNLYRLVFRIQWQELDALLHV